VSSASSSGFAENFPATVLALGWRADSAASFHPAYDEAVFFLLHDMTRATRAGFDAPGQKIATGESQNACLTWCCNFRKI